MVGSGDPLRRSGPAALQAANPLALTVTLRLFDGDGFQIFADHPGFVPVGVIEPNVAVVAAQLEIFQAQGDITNRRHCTVSHVENDYHGVGKVSDKNAVPVDNRGPVFRPSAIPGEGCNSGGATPGYVGDSEITDVRVDPEKIGGALGRVETGVGAGGWQRNPPLDLRGCRVEGGGRGAR